MSARHPNNPSNDPKREDSRSPERGRDTRDDRPSAPQPRRDEPNVTDRTDRHDSTVESDPRRQNAPRPSYPDPAPVATDDEDSAMDGPPR